MKISSKVGLIVVVIVLVAALVGLYTVYSRQAREQDTLDEKLSRAQTLLPGLTANKKTIEDQLASATSSLATSQAQFPTSVESIEYDDDLFEIADSCDVDITKLSASKPSDKKIGTVTYSISPFVLVVTGATDNILEFIYAIRVGDDFQLPWSAEVKSVSWDLAGSAATINLDIYGYKR